MNARTLFARGVVVIGGFVLVLGAAVCAAPDAKPGPDRIEPPPNPDAGQPDSGDDKDAGMDADPVEPIAGDPTWASGYGEGTNDQKFFDIAFDSKSNTFVSTLGYINYITIPGLNNDLPYVSGAFGSNPPVSVQNILVFKQDAATHAPLWAVPIRAGNEIVRSIVDVDAEENVIVAGGFAGKLEIQLKDGTAGPSTSSLGSYDAFLAKFNSLGEPIWMRSFGVAGEDYITDVAVDGNGNIVVVGYATSTMVDFGDGKQVSTITGKDLFVAKYDGSGNVLWAHRVGEGAATDMLGKNNWREPTATVEVSRIDGSIIIGGTYRGSLSFPPKGISEFAAEDGFIAKLDAAGNGVWGFGFGSANCKQRVRSVAIGPKGEVALTGAFQGSVSIGGKSFSSFKGSRDLFVAMLEADGTPRWVHNYGALGDQLGSKVLVDATGRVFVGGSFTGTIDFFDSGTLTNTTKEQPFTPTDIFVAKFKDDGAPLWAHAWGDADPNVLVGIQTIEGGAFWTNDKDEDFVVFGGINSGTMDFDGMVQSIKAVGFEDAYMMSITY